MPWWIIENTLLAALLALLVSLVSRARHVPPVVRHGLWLVVLIKLIVPPVFSLGITVPNSIGSQQIARQAGGGTQPVFDVSEESDRDASLHPPAETDSHRIDERSSLERTIANDVLPEDEPGMFWELDAPQAPSAVVTPSEESPKALPEFEDIQPCPSQVPTWPRMS